MSDSTSSDRLAELMPAFVLGALDADERAEVEALLAADPARAERLLAEWRATAAAVADELGREIEPVRPSDLARARLLRDLGVAPRPVGPRLEEPRAGRSDRAAAANPWPMRLAAAAALLAALWAGAGQWKQRGELERLERDRAELTRAMAATRAELAAARRDLETTVWAQRVVASPDVRPIVLAGLGPLPQARAHTFVDPLDRRAVFYAYNLPPAEAGRIYQLWFIAGGVPVSAGIFDADARGRASLHVEGVAPIDSIQAWAVTVEPAGGVPQPTGPMVLKG